MGPKGQLVNGNSTAAASEAELSKQAEQDGSGKVVVQYRECQRNHAAGIGGYAVDGCREFLACLPPQDLLCAACGCHRSFHKRELAADSDSGFSSSSSAAAGAAGR